MLSKSTRGISTVQLAVLLGCLLFLPGAKCGNLALHQPTVQSSTYKISRYAVDGSSSGNFSSDVCSSTSWGPDPWWRVDLGKSYLVNQVYIINRVDCCKERLDGFEIRIGDHLKNDGNSNPKCGNLHSMAAIEKKSFNCTPAMRGRYVNIRIPGGSQMLTLCEVIVNSNPSENIAFQKNAVQSSKSHGGVPSRAGDGNSDGFYWHYSCTHTVAQTSPWWRVDLGQSKPISEVFIVNRDSILQRLNNVEVRVGNDLSNNGNNNAQCGELFSMITEYKKSVYCKPRKTGRYVNVRLLGNNQILTLCEVSVYSESRAFLRDKPYQPSSVLVYADKFPVQLTCPEPFGFPVPHVAWMFDGSILQNSTKNSTLRLKLPPVTPQNHTIECVITNKHGADFHQFHLQFLSRFSMCADYKDIAQKTRDFQNKATDSDTAEDDSSLTNNQWIRFVGSGSPRQLPEHCVDSWSCGTQASGWLHGQHPLAEDNVVERTVCFSWNGECCFYQTNVLVRKCYGHYVYKLKKTGFPVKARYCTASRKNSDKEKEVLFTSSLHQGEGYALQGHVIHTESNVRDTSNCMSYCLIEKSCVSFNFYPNKEVCELSDATRLQDLENFRSRPGCNYFEKSKTKWMNVQHP